MNAVLWLAALLNIYSVIVSNTKQCVLVNKTAALYWHFRSVYEEDLDEAFNN